MTQRSWTIAGVICSVGSWSLIACVADTSEPQQTVQDPKVTALYATGPSQCERGILESDLFTLPLDGAGVSFGTLKPGQYVLSTTYLRLKDTDAASSKFWEVMSPISEDLSKRDGLVALSLALSLECNTARTLSVWRDDVAMMEFVTGSAHSAAVAVSSQLSRGGSVVMHWTGDDSQATWGVATQKLADYTGPTL